MFIKGKKTYKEDKKMTEQKTGSVWVTAKQCGKTCVELNVLGEVICYASKFLEDPKSVWTMVMENMNDKQYRWRTLSFIWEHSHSLEDVLYISLLQETVFEVEVVHID